MASDSKSEKGFTFIELMVAMTIVFVVGIIGIPYYIELKYSLSRSSAKQMFKADLRFTKSKALEEGVRAILDVHAGYSSYGIGLDNLPYSSSGEADQQLAVRNLPDGITISTNTAFIFDSRGYLVDNMGSPASATVTLAHDGDVFSTLTVYSSGMVTDES